MWHARTSGRIACSLLILCLVQPLRGENVTNRSARLQEGAVAGQVLDAETGEPVAGAQVVIVELQIGALADEAGEFRIEDVPVGSYTLRARFLGFQTLERSIRVERDQVHRIQLTLEPEAIRLRELIVTPRRRVEVAAEAPITETVLDAVEIRDADINDPQDFLDFTPNATMFQSQNTGTGAFISIRGIAQQRNSQTPVAVLVDDVLQISPLQFNQALYDVERVEIIKGPEGALYGRNALAGAILIKTREPTNEFRGYLQMSGGQASDVGVQAAYGGPIVEEKLLFRVAGRFRTRDGYFTNVTLDEPHDFYRTASMRGKLRWQVSPKLRLDFKGLVDRTESNPNQFDYQPAIMAANGQELADTPFPFDFGRINSNKVDRTPEMNNLGFGERDMEQASLRLTYDWDLARVESITAYHAIRNTLIADGFPYTGSLTRIVDGLGVVDGTQNQWKDVEGLSHELRFLSPRDQPLRWQLGGYFLTWDRFKSATVGEDRGQGVKLFRREPGFDDPTNPTLSWLADDNDNEAWAVFGNLEYDVSDDLTVSGAARFDQELREQFVSDENTAGEPGAVNEATFDKAQPKFRVSYRPSLQGSVVNFLNLYGSWGIGFRSGRFNQNGVRQAAEEAGIEGVRNVINQEVARTWEVGFKTRWFNNRLSLNSAFFRTDDEGQPFFIFIPQISAQVLVNIPDADIKGFESTLRGKLAEGLDAYVGVGVTDSEIREFPVDPTAVGKKLPLVPENTLNVGAQYRGKLSTDWGFFARVDFERLGEVAWTPTNSTPRDAIQLLNLQGGLEFGDWTAKFAYKNVTDEVYNSEFVQGGFAFPAPPDRWRVILETPLSGPDGL